MDCLDDLVKEVVHASTSAVNELQLVGSPLGEPIIISLYDGTDFF